MAKDNRTYVIKPMKTGAEYDPRLFEKGAPKNGELDFDKDKDGLRKSAHYKLNFTIDNSGLADADKLMFAPRDQDVMAVHTNLDDCPATGTQMLDTFWVDKNKDGKLRLINMDLKQQKLRFNINMVRTDDPTGPFIPLDPIVNNGNRGAPEPFMEFRLAPIVAGAIAGIGAALAVNAGLLPTNPIVFAIGGAVIGAIVGLALDRR